MKLGRTNSLRISLLTVLIPFDSAVFNLFRHAGRQTETSQQSCDKQRP